MGAPRRVKLEPGIYERPDGRLEIGFRDSSGKQRWRKVDGGIMAARRSLAEAKAQRARGERVAADPRLKFDTAAQAWWDARVLRLRPNTQQAYGSALAHLRRPEHFGRARLVDITATDVARFVTAQQAAGWKGSTIRGQVTALGSVFTYASRHLGFAGVNPVSLLDRVERPSTDDERPKRILAGDELARLLAAVDEDYRLIFEFAAETGARLGEVLGIVWGDIDLEGETVAFSHQLDRRRRREPLKTKRSRRVLEVTPDLIARLRAAKVASPRSRDHDLVFVTSVGSGHDHRNVGGRVLARAVKRAGLEAVLDDDGKTELVPAPTFHGFRHTHASALIADGWDIVEISQRLGHSDIATTMKVYSHEFEVAKRSASRRSRLVGMYGADRGSADGSARTNATLCELDGAEPDAAQLRVIGVRTHDAAPRASTS